MQQLFYNNNTKMYYLLCSKEDMIVKCTHCNRLIEIEETFYMQRSFGKKVYVKNYYCQTCVSHHNKRVYDEFSTVELNSNVPKGSILVPDYPPTLVSKNNVTVFGAALSNDGINADCSSVEVDDYTRLSGRESLEGVGIGRDMKEELEFKDKPLKGEQEFECFMEALQESTAITFDEEKNKANLEIEEFNNNRDGKEKKVLEDGRTRGKKDRVDL